MRKKEWRKQKIVKISLDLKLFFKRELIALTMVILKQQLKILLNVSKANIRSFSQ